ncbi:MULTISPECIES: hypothetical protein [unclassified Streptomyces]|uniref:hypothetical protein n=1 Tax=unclassified Streptomyces TaxID=2593676 RepID=UPI000DD7C76F|nr:MULTISPECIES: hypothetical protein [unclassified Streptomyces]QZZ28425.1 hypothetical protein A7X85_21005 [Streptomyces sp. ST1015]
MRLSWLAWLGQNFGEYGYSDGLLKAVTGTVAVLVTAFIVWVTLHRHRAVALSAAGAVGVLGIAWLAFH